MLVYKFDVGDALKRAGYNMYKAKKSGLISQETLKKIRKEDTNLKLQTLDALCCILDMQPKDIFEYVETEADIEKKQKIKKSHFVK